MNSDVDTKVFGDLEVYAKVGVKNFKSLENFQAGVRKSWDYHLLNVSFGLKQLVSFKYMTSRSY